MLVEFSVENYRSFQEKQTLSMVAAEDDETMLNSNTVPMPNTDDLRLVTSAAIYGTNASGKSNLIKAIYAKLRPNQQTAINNAIKLENKHFNEDGCTNPSTKVHHLVQKLQDQKEFK